MDATRLIVTDDKGNDIEMEIVFTFEDDVKKRKYVIYYDPQDDSGEVYASAYDDEGNLFPIDEDEWQMVDEVFGAYMNEMEDDEEEASE